MSAFSCILVQWTRARRAGISSLNRDLTVLRKSRAPCRKVEDAVDPGIPWLLWIPE